MKLIDISLNIILPLVTGIAIYQYGWNQVLPSIVRNQLPDALWAYAFMNCILIIWNRTLQPFWILLPFCIAAGFEFLQNNHLLRGTADLLDILTYYISFIIALFFNYLLKPVKKTNDQYE
jgi:ABC-type branched-subunit amino acid transport system permease subunit